MKKRAGFLALYFLLTIAPVFIMEPIEKALGTGALNTTLVDLFLRVLTVVALWLLIRFVLEERPQAFFLGGERPVRDYLVGAALGFVLMSILVVLNLFAGKAVFHGVGTMSPLYILLFAVAFMIQSFSEELMVRGLIQRLVLDVAGVWGAILIPSIAFGLMHLGNDHFSILAMVNTILIGMIFSIHTFLSRNLWLAAGMHFTWNYFLGPIYQIPVSGHPFAQSALAFTYADAPLWNGSAYGVEAALLCTVLLCVYLLILIKIFNDSGKVRTQYPSLIEKIRKRDS